MERRTFLVLGAAVLGLAGCTGHAPSPPSDRTPTTPQEADPDDAVRSAAAASELALISAYRTAIDTYPQVADRLSPFLAHHEAHLTRIAPERAAEALPSPAGGQSATGSASPSGRDAPSGGGAQSGGEGPATAVPTHTTSPSPTSSAVSETLAALADAESAARRERIAGCDSALDPALARNLTLIAASEAQHAAILGALAEESS